MSSVVAVAGIPPTEKMQRTVGGSYHGSNASNVSRYTFYVLVFLSAFMPAEDFFLKFLPGPDAVFFATRFISELLVYGLFFWVVVHKISIKAFAVRTPVDAPILLFAVGVVLSLIVNVNDLEGYIVGIVNIRPLFKYIALFYVLANTPLSPRQVNTVIWVVIATGAVLAFAGLAQYLAGGALDSIFLPKEVDIEVAGEQRRSRILEGTREIGAVYGMCGDTIYFGLAMTVAAIVYVVKLRAGMIVIREIKQAGVFDSKAILIVRRNFVLLAMLAVITVAGMLTYSRACQMAVVAVIALEMFYWLSKKRAAVVAALGLAALLTILIAFPPSWSGGGATRVSMSPLEDFTSMFSLDYLENNLKDQRLHQIVRVSPTVLINRPVFGYGPEEAEALAMLNNDEPTFMARKLLDREFQDVYWVAILVRFGLLGLFGFAAIFFVLLRASAVIYRHSDNPVLRDVALIVANMTVVSILLMFLERVYELRAFSFYLWSFAGLMFGLNSTLTNQKVAAEEARASEPAR